MTFNNRPVLVFWECTRACSLSCIHCRASAITEPLPGELATNEAKNLIDQVLQFGRPSPTIIFTGGDPLMRSDLFELLKYSANAGAGFAVSPAIAPYLTRDAMIQLVKLGATSISVSLDGASAETHDFIRGRAGTFEKTLATLRMAPETGLPVQVNTTIMRRNYRELPEIFHLIRTLGVKTWELFFLVKVGRGNAVEDLFPTENESVCNFLYDASFYNLTIRCVEAPFIRRVSKQRIETPNYWDSDLLYSDLRNRLITSEGTPAPSARSTLRPSGTLDGDGIIFVAYDGTIQPGGLLPFSLGNVRKDSLIQTYRSNEILRDIRERRFGGPCGSCSFREICGGSRARAFACSGDPLASDPACICVSSNLGSEQISNMLEKI